MHGYEHMPVKDAQGSNSTRASIKQVRRQTLRTQQSREDAVVSACDQQKQNDRWTTDARQQAEQRNDAYGDRAEHRGGKRQTQVGQDAAPCTEQCGKHDCADRAGQNRGDEQLKACE